MAEEKDLLKKIAMLEQQLDQSDACIRSVMEGLPFVAWLKDIDGKFIYVNEKYLELYNLKSADQLLGKTDYDLFPKVEADKYKAEEDQLIKEKKGIAYNGQRQQVDKEDSWFTTIKTPVVDSKGNVLGTTGIHRDITERVVNRSKYEFESNLLQALLDSIPDTIYFKDRESHFIRVNRAKSEEVGHSNPDDLIGKSDADFFTKEETMPRVEDEQKIIKTGIPLINKIEHAVDSKGIDKWVSSTKCAIRDKNGEITGLVGISRNVTETKKALIALEREKEFMQLLMDHIQHTIYFKDTENRFTKINKAQARMLGVENPEDAIGKTDYDFFKGDHSGKAFHDEKEIMRTGVPIIDKVEKLINAEGKEKWVSATKYPTYDRNGKITGTVGMSVDITDKMIYEEKLKEAKEKAEESDRLKTAFLSNMSHEIRTPMNGIIGFSNLLRDSNLTDNERIEFLNHINICGNQLLALIDDIIDISKIESGQVKIQMNETHVNSILNELFTTYQANKENDGKTHIELIKKATLSDDKSVIYTDTFRLRQVLSNLIGNGIKFTSEGKVEFGYNLLENGYLQFFVKDTGIGIPKDKQQVIFERFGQVMDSKNISTLTMTHKGTGLGLAISANMIRLLGGDLWVESEVGKGSTFFLTLPYKPFSAKDMESATIDITSVNIAGKTILFAEDEETNFTYFKDILKNHNAKILWVKNGLDAVYSVKVNPDIELVLMDCRMPGMDGFSATAEIKKIRPTLPIIAQTSFALADEREKCLKYGSSDYICKPLLIQELFALFKKYLRK